MTDKTQPDERVLKERSILMRGGVLTQWRIYSPDGSSIPYITWDDDDPTDPPPVPMKKAA